MQRTRAALQSGCWLLLSSLISSRSSSQQQPNKSDAPATTQKILYLDLMGILHGAYKADKIISLKKE